VTEPIFVGIILDAWLAHLESVWLLPPDSFNELQDTAEKECPTSPPRAQGRLVGCSFRLFGSVPQSSAEHESNRSYEIPSTNCNQLSTLQSCFRSCHSLCQPMSVKLGLFHLSCVSSIRSKDDRMKPMPPTTNCQQAIPQAKVKHALRGPKEHVDHRRRPVITIKPFNYAWKTGQGGYPEDCSSYELYKSLSFSQLSFH
jgi:hypothetical protein